MGRKRYVSHEAVSDVIKRLMLAMADPAFAAMPGPVMDVEAELAEVDDFLDLLTPPSLPVSALAATVAASEPVSGTKPITIRLHNRVINAFKDEASRTGANYQTLMHRALADASEEFAL